MIRRNVLELRQLVTFRTVAHTLNFTRAAEELQYVQPNITAQIQALEEELGVLLFERLGKRVVLTDAGKRMLPYTEQVLHILEEMRVAVPGGEEVVGMLTIGAAETVCTYRLPPLLNRFRERFPRVQILLKPILYRSSSELREFMQHGALDVAFVLETRLQVPGLLIEDLMPEPLVLCARPGHPLLMKTSIEPVDVRNETVLLSPAGCRYRRIFEQTFAQANVQLTSIVELHSVEAIKQCAVQGMGIAVLPQVAVSSELAQGTLARLPWTGENFQIRTHLVRHKEKWLSPVLEAFLLLTHEMLSDFNDTYQ